MPSQKPKDRVAVFDFSTAGPLCTRRIMLAIEAARKTLEAQGVAVSVKKARRKQSVTK